MRPLTASAEKQFSPRAERRKSRALFYNFRNKMRPSALRTDFKEQTDTVTDIFTLKCADTTV